MQSKYTWIDVVPGDDPEKFHISEHDDRSRHLMLRIYAREGEIELSDSATVEIEGKKPDGTELHVTGSRINLACTFDLPAEAASVPGEVPCKILIADGNKKIYTELFILVVDPDTGEEE